MDGQCLARRTRRLVSSGEGLEGANDNAIWKGTTTFRNATEHQGLGRSARRLCRGAPLAWEYPNQVTENPNVSLHVHCLHGRPHLQRRERPRRPRHSRRWRPLAARRGHICWPQPIDWIARSKAGRLTGAIRFLSGDVDLVTLTIRGSDALWTEMLTHCYVEFDCFGLASDFPGHRHASRRFHGRQDSVGPGTRRRDAPRHQQLAAPDAVIVLAGYPFLVPETDEEQKCGKFRIPRFGQALAELEPSELASIRSLQAELDELLRAGCTGGRRAFRVRDQCIRWS